MTQSDSIQTIMTTSPVIPVIVIDDLTTAVPLCEALVSGGLRVLEITLRTPVALDAIRQVADALPEAIVGVGTATVPEDINAARDAGAQFAVSPGYTTELGQACRALSMPFLPGIMTPADIIRAQQDNYTALKFFPAEQAGGTALLKALAGPFPETVFCPTGGVNADNVNHYLSLGNVLCVGGSWVAPKALVQQQDWPAITALAKAAAQLTA